MKRMLGCLVMALALGLAGCNGPTGPDGKTGPGGPTGPTGPTGPGGPSGKDGKDGTSGVDGTSGTNGTNGKDGTSGSDGTNGTNGKDGKDGSSTGSIAGAVKDAIGNPLAGVVITTVPASTAATSAADGKFSLSGVSIGAYNVVAKKADYTDFTLPNVGVTASGTTNVSLVLQIAANAPGSIAGRVTDTQVPAVGLLGVVVTVEGTALSATTGVDGSFTIANVPPGPVFLHAAAPSASFLDSDTRQAAFVAPDGAVTGVTLALSARPSDAATYTGMGGSNCVVCHAKEAAMLTDSAHLRSLTSIQRDANGHAVAGAFSRVVNATLTAPRKVMIPLTGNLALASTSTAVVGTGTAFTTELAIGAVIGYTPKGLGFTALGTVQSITDDTHLALAANATLAPGVTSEPSVRFGKDSATLKYTHLWPEDFNDIAAPSWPGVKATNPNYDPNDPCIYNAPASGTCAAGGTVKYADGQVHTYLCNLKGSTDKGGNPYTTDEYVQKFGGLPFSCSDGAFYDGVTTPAVPMVHIEMIYGGEGDRHLNGATLESKPNMGVFKQRYQGRLADVKAADSWTYTTPAAGFQGGKGADSLTLPIQLLQSGDAVNGAPKLNGYHPTEQKFPAESWSQRSRTFSHSCAGCHNTGLKLAWDMKSFPYFDGTTANQAAIKTYDYIDQNVTCEHCHGPGSEHVAAPGRGKAIINPKYLTAESDRQNCGKCHGYDDAQNASPVQDYGFEFPWNDANAGKIGGGSYVPGVYQVGNYIGNWSGRLTDEEAFWDPSKTGGKLYGQAHRQQYLMLGFAKHTNNPFEKLTCTNCHDPHSTFKVTAAASSDKGDAYAFANADFRNNVSCLSCHAGFGPFAAVTKDHVAAVHLEAKGTVTKNGTAVIAPDEATTIDAERAIAQAVAGHMQAKASMSNVLYEPTNDQNPVGRCTTCHMPKVAKSGGYTTGPDFNGNESIVEGDQASHVFDIIWPWQSMARSVSGPTAASAPYGTKVINGVTYNKFGYMPNSCDKCHTGSRKASDFVP